MSCYFSRSYSCPLYCNVCRWFISSLSFQTVSRMVGHRACPWKRLCVVVDMDRLLTGFIHHCFRLHTIYCTHCKPYCISVRLSAGQSLRPPLHALCCVMQNQECSKGCDIRQCRSGMLSNPEIDQETNSISQFHQPTAPRTGASNSALIIGVFWFCKVYVYTLLCKVMESE